jgi:hypothetical protein
MSPGALSAVSGLAVVPALVVSSITDKHVARRCLPAAIGHGRRSLVGEDRLEILLYSHSESCGVLKVGISKDSWGAGHYFLGSRLADAVATLLSQAVVDVSSSGQPRTAALSK